MMQEFVQEIKNTINESINEIHTALPAVIVSVDKSTGLAVVKPTMKKFLPCGKKLDYPQITGVPIVFPQGNGQTVSISFPVKAGDGCLLIIAEQSLEYWLYGRETSTTLPYDITNAICIPGLFASANSMFYEACNTNSVIIDATETRITVNDSGVEVIGNVTITGSNVKINSSNVKINGDVTIDDDVDIGGDVSIDGDLKVSGKIIS